MKILIIGRGKIATSIKKNKIKNISFIEEKDIVKNKNIDYMFICCHYKKASKYIKKYMNLIDKKIIDFSGYSKYKGLNPKEKDYTYAFKEAYNPNAKIIAMQGCSAYGVSNILYPIKDEINKIENPIFIDVTFPITAISNNSKNKKNLNNNIIGLLYNKHDHQKELRKLFNNKNIIYSPKISTNDKSIFINIFISSKNSLSVYNKLKKYIKNSNLIKEKETPLNNTNIKESDEIECFLEKVKNGLIINLTVDNMPNLKYISYLK